jgi:hypothetical protein
MYPAARRNRQRSYCARLENCGYLPVRTETQKPPRAISPGTVDVAQPSRPRLPPQWRKAWVPRVFVRHSIWPEEVPKAPRRQRRCSSVPQNHHPGQLAAQTAFHTHWARLVGNMDHRSPHLRLLDAHFHHFLGHISQALQRAGRPAANFRISDLAVLSQHSYWTYLSSFGR